MRITLPAPWRGSAKFCCLSKMQGTSSARRKVNLKKAADAVNELCVCEKVELLNGHVPGIVKAEGRTLDFHVQGGSDDQK